MTLNHVQFQAGRRDQAKATLDSFVKEKSRIYIEIEKLNQEKVEILKEVRNVSSLSSVQLYIVSFLRMKFR